MSIRRYRVLGLIAVGCYRDYFHPAMTREQIDAILERVRSWPQPRQEDAARLLLAMEADEKSMYVLSSDEREDLEVALAEISRGEIASDAEVAAVFSRRGE
jgi:hypothetical protein